MNIVSPDVSQGEALDIRKGIIQLFNSKEYHELQRYYKDKSFFDVLGIMRNENVHSNFLSWILNPEEKHGLNEYPIRKFLEMIIISLYDCKYAENKDKLFPEYLMDYIITGNYHVSDVLIEREKVIDNNKRIDLFIELVLKIKSNEKEAVNLKIILENKVYSKEHSDQTLWYHQWAEKNLKENTELLYIYLTPLSTRELLELNEQQSLCKNYIQINYQYLVDYVLEPCRMQQMSEETGFIIENYLRCLSYPSLDEESINKGGLVMAVSEKERKLLLDFWEVNKPLLLAMLNILKDDDSIDEEERKNMDSMINMISKKSNKDFSKYKLNNNTYGKNRLVLAVVKEHLRREELTYEELKLAFPDYLQGAWGVIQRADVARGKDIRRYFLKPEELLTTEDGIEIAVSTQWGSPNIDNFIEAAVKLGYDIERIE